MEIKFFQFNPLQENTYILYDETRNAIVIDCGCLYEEENRRLQQFISDNNLIIRRVLNTHLHLDHAFGNYFLAQTYNILPEAHEDDERLGERIADVAEVFGIKGDVRSQKLGGYLHDGDMISVGNMQLKVLHTPGHTRGGICFYAENEKTVFTGDTLFCGSIGRTDLPGGDFETIMRSIGEKLLTLPDDTVVFSGHGIPTTIGQEKRENPYL